MGAGQSVSLSLLVFSVREVVRFLERECVALHGGVGFPLSSSCGYALFIKRGGPFCLGNLCQRFTKRYLQEKPRSVPRIFYPGFSSDFLFSTSSCHLLYSEDNIEREGLELRGIQRGKKQICFSVFVAVSLRFL